MRREGQDSGAKIGSTGVRAFGSVDNPEAPFETKTHIPDIEHVYKVKTAFNFVLHVIYGTSSIIYFYIQSSKLL